MRTLVVIRGNSGSGKSTVARELQHRYGRGCALVEQDYLRRMVLRERDFPGGLAPTFIAHTVSFLLANGYHVVLDGILAADMYGDALAELRRAHGGPTFFFYLDVSLEETLRRHRTRPQAAEFTPDQMRGWYRAEDLLHVTGERVIPESSTIDETVASIAATSGLRAGEGGDLEPHRPPTILVT
jgi:predicted kinase